MSAFYQCYKCDEIVYGLNYVKLHLIRCDLLRPSSVNYWIGSVAQRPDLVWTINISDPRLVLTKISLYKKYNAIYIESIANNNSQESFPESYKTIYDCLCIAGLISESPSCL